MALLLTVIALAATMLAIALVAADRTLMTARVGALATISPGSAGSAGLAGLMRIPRSISSPVIAGAAFVAGFLVAGPVTALAGLVAGLGVPVALRRRNLRREAAHLDVQLGDGVSTIAAGLRAGLSLSQSIRVAADESLPPLSVSLRRVVEREAVGVPLNRSLDLWAAEHDGPDVRLVATVFQLHRRSGGDLPSVLDGVASTLRERAAQARESQSLTAQARLSGLVLGFLPIGFFCFLSVMSPQDMATAYRTPAGVGAISMGVLLQAGAFIWIRHLLRVQD